MKKEVASTKTKVVKTAKKTTKKIAKPVQDLEKVSMPIATSPKVTNADSSMPNSTKIALGVAAAVCLGLGFLYVKFWNIAIVNGNPISRIAYYQTMESQIGKQTLSNMITEKLIEDAAEKQNVIIDDKVVNDKVADIETKIKAQGQTLDAALEAEGITRAELNRQIKIQLIVEQLGAGAVEVTDAQIDTYIKDNQSLLPKDSTAAEIRTMVKSQLESQAKNTNIQTWLENLKTSASIIYR